MAVAGAGLGAGGAAGSGGEAGRSEAGAGGAGERFPGDINDDGCVDLRDYAILTRCWNKQTSHCAVASADLQSDGYVDFSDYLIFVAHWHQGPTCQPWCEESGVAPGAAGAGGAGPEPTGNPDLNMDGCVNLDDLDLLAQSFGCGPDCAAPGTDLVPDGCVDTRDQQFLFASFDASGPCVQWP